MVDTIQREAVYLWYYFSVQLEQIFKYWVLGMVLGSAISVFAKEHIHSLFASLGERKLGFFGIVAASILVIVSPLCMYGTIPIAASFSKSGIGKVTALTLAKQGHTVIIHGRDSEKTKRVFDEIKRETGSKSLDMITADLSIMSEVKVFADKIKAKYDRLDVLINNAGGQFGSVRKETSEGHEKTMAINVFSPFLLTYLLLEILKKSPSSRVVTVASESYRQGGKPILEDIELKNNYTFGRAYGLSKLYVYWIMQQFVGLSAQEGIKNITFNTVEPGSANTELGRISTQETMMKIIYYLWKPMMWSVEKAAATSIYMATAKEVEGVSGEFYGKCKKKNIRSKFRSEQGEKAVWDYCMEVCRPYLHSEKGAKS